MKVKIGDDIYDAEYEPIMIIMSKEEKEVLLKNFCNTQATKYCIYPDEEYWNKDDYKNIKKWMDI